MHQSRKAWFFALLLLASPACDQPVEERIDNVYRLQMDPTPENVVKLRGLAEDPDPDVRVTALNSLVTLRVDDAAQLAVTALEDPNAFVRATAAKLVGDLGDPELTGFLVRRLEGDPDPLVRKRACRALTDTAGPDSGPALVRALRDPDPQVRLEAIRGAKVLAPGEGTAPLIELLEQDPTWEIRVQAASALGRSSDPAAGPALRAALEDPVEFVRAAAAKALDEYRPVTPPPAAAEEPN